MNKYQIFLILVCLLLDSAPSIWSKTIYVSDTCYAVYDLTEFEYNHGWIVQTKSKIFNTDGALCSKLEFEAKKSENTQVGSINVYIKYANEAEVYHTLKMKDLTKNQYKTFEYDLSGKQVEYVKLEAKATSYKTSFRNVKVTLATRVIPSADTVDCGSATIFTSSVTTPFSIAWSNTPPLTLTIDDTTNFSLNQTAINSALCAFGTESGFTVTFHPQQQGVHTATVVVANADSTWATLTITGFCIPHKTTLILPVAGNTITYGQKLSEVQLVGGCAKTLSGDTIAGDFMWTNKDVVPQSGLYRRYPITFVPYDRVRYADTYDSITVTVHKAPQNIVWLKLDSLGIMDSVTLHAKATSNLPVSYTITGSGAAYATIDNNGQLDITATAQAIDKQLIITVEQEGNENYLPAASVTSTITLRKTRADFFAATEPIKIPRGSTIALNSIKPLIHTEASVSGTWEFDATAPTTLHACIWTLKAIFTPTNQQLCDVITVEIPVIITDE